MEKHKDQPFALIGVNSDPRETAKARQSPARINWRSFWDGGTNQGPIASRWHVQGWPTIYLLDAQGMIRFKSIGPMDKMADNVEQLLAEMKLSPEKTE